MHFESGSKAWVVATVLWGVCQWGLSLDAGAEEMHAFVGGIRGNV